MSGATLALRRADESDLTYVERLLEANDLPSSDVRDKPECFYVATDGESGDRVGVGGIEVHGSDGLLRSVAVEESVRGQGYGTAVSEALGSEARDRGVERLYLLTTTAAEFFAERGYEVIERDEAPDSIRQTTEFDDLCPTSATCMRRSLSD